MKTFTKHILLLALMLFGVAGAAWAQTHQKYTGPVAFSVLQQGDTLAPGFSITGLGSSQTLSFQGNRYKQDGVLEDGNYSFYGNNVTGYGGDNPVTIIAFGSSLYTPVNESGQDGNAWVVTATANNFVRIGGISLAPDPYVPALDETTGHWNFLMPGSNKVVKAVLYDSVLIGANVAVQCSTGCSNIAYGYRNAGGDSILYFENSPILTLTANAPEGKAFDGWTDGNTDNPRVVNLEGDTAFLPIFYTPRTLTLNQTDGGSLALDGYTPGSFTVSTFEFPADWSELSMSYYIMAEDLPADFTPVTEAEMRNWNPGIEGNYIVFFRPHTDDRAVIAKYIDGVATSYSLTARKKTAASTYEGYQIYYVNSSTPAVLPAGVLSVNADGSFNVKSGTELTLVATPDSAHYLSAIGNEAVISNSAYNYSFTMPDEDTELAATFTTKPTLTLTQTDGGTLEAIVPQGNAVWGDGVSNLILAHNYTADGITFTTTNGTDMPSHGQWFASSSKQLHFTSESGNFSRIEMTLTGNYGYTNWNDAEGWTVDANTAVWEGNANEVVIEKCTTYVKQITFVRGTANVIASSTPNTYIIDYGTPVTVVATPDAQHYLVRFSDDDNDTNSNVAVEKTYDSVINSKTLSANFQAKPTLTLTHNDGGTMSVLPGDGIIDASARIYTLTFTGFNNGNMNTSVQVNASEFPVTLTHINGNEIGGDNLWNDFAWINGAVASNDDGKMNCSVYNDYHNFSITISGAFDGTANIHVDGANGDWGGEARDISVSCVLTTNDIAYIVDYGTEVTVTATPDSIHYLATLGGVTMGSNTAKDTTFTVTATTNLEANFTQKPTLTLAHNDGGEMEIVPEEVMAVNEFTIPSSWNNDNTLAAATDLPSDFQSVSEAEARAWQNTTGHPVYLFFKAYASGTVAYVRFNANGTVADVSTGLKSVIYNNVSDVYEGYLVRYTTVGAASNFIASTTEPNTYYIDYGTDVTVKATPDATHYLVNFDGTDVRNDNDTATKTYENITANDTAYATFNDKPTLALTSNEGGEMSLPGYTPGSFTVSTFEFPVDWSDLSMSYFIMAEDLPADFTPVTEAEMRNWNPGIEGNYIVFFRPHTDDRAVIAKYIDGVATSYSLTARKKTAASTYEGYQIYYVNSSTPAVFPEGVAAANNTLDTFVVNYGASVTVKATPSDTAYLVRFDQDADTNSNTAVEKTYGPLTAALTTAEATFNAKPVLTLAQNESWGSVTVEGAGSAGGAGGEVTIGDSTSTSVNAYIPGYTLYDYAYSQQIYTADEIGLSGDITSLTMWLKNTSSYARNLEVYMKEVEESTFADNNSWVSLSDGDLVATGTMDNEINTPVNYTFNLTTPFHYSGTGNLLLCIRDVTGSWSSGLGGVDMDATGNQAIYAYRDGTVYDISNPGVMGTLLQKKNVVKFNIAGSGAAAGVVQLTDSTYRVDYGQTVTVNAEASELHHVAGWQDQNGTAMDTATYGEGQFPTTSSLTFMVTGDTTARALFGINSYDVTATATLDNRAEVGTGLAMGTVSANYTDIQSVPQTVLPDDTITFTAQGGSTSTLTAQPAYGYLFDHWTVGDNTYTDDTLTLTLTEASTVVAVFVPDTFTVSSSLAIAGSAQVSGTGAVAYLESTALVATPATGYHFTEWQNVAGTQLDTTATLTVQVLGDTTVVAVMDTNTYVLTVVSANEVMGTVTGSNPAAKHFVNYPISATANYGYHFTQWNDNNTEASRNVTLTEATTYTASFDYNQYTVTGQPVATTDVRGTVSGSSTVNYLTNVTLEATPTTGYHFVQWQNAAGSVLGTATTLTVQALRDSMVYAVFDTNVYNVSADVNIAGLGTVTGMGQVKHFLSTDLVATANQGYHFVEWQNAAGSVLGTANSITVSPMSDTVLTAVFDTNIYATVWSGETTVIYNAQPYSGLGATYTDFWGNVHTPVLTFTCGSTTITTPNYPVTAGTWTVTATGEVGDSLTNATTTLTINRATVYVSGAQVETAKFADGNTDAVVTNPGTLNNVQGSDAVTHSTSAAFNDATVGDNKTITLTYTLNGTAALLANYNLTPATEVYTTSGYIIEPMTPDTERQGDDTTVVEEGMDIYAYGYCTGSSYGIRYHLNSGNPDQYKIDYADARFTDVAWTDLATAGANGTIEIVVPVDLPTGDYSLTVTFRDSRFPWLESNPFTFSFHVNLPETYTLPMFDDVIALVDSCHCFTDIQWYHRANSSEEWQAIPGANGYYYREEGGLTGEYFVRAKMNGVETYTCPQTDVETLADDGMEEVSVNAYPNPTTDNITVTISGSLQPVHTLRIINTVGVEMERRTFEGESTLVDMRNYQRGNYVVTIDGVVVRVIRN